MFNDDELKMLRDSMGTEAYEQRKFIDSVPNKETKKLSTIQLKKIEKLQEKLNFEINKHPTEKHNVFVASAVNQMFNKTRAEMRRFTIIVTPISKATAEFWKEQELAAYSITLKHIGKRLQQMEGKK